MSDNLAHEKLLLRDYLLRRDVTYDARAKTWRCPFHPDENPSATLYENPDGHVLTCHVCGKSWDIFQVVGQLEHITEFKEQLKYVRDMAGIFTDRPKSAAKKKADPMPFPDDKKIEFEEKIKSLCAKHGEIKGLWKYTDAEGLTIGVDVRYEREGQRKVILTFWYDGRTLRWADAPVLIYNLAEVIREKEKPILIHEGSKCSEVAKVLENFTSVSWSGGSAKASFIDWTIFNNREIYIYPDDDKPGFKASSDIAKHFVQSHAHIVRPPEAARTIKSKGADIVEALQIMTPEELTAYILDPDNWLENGIADIEPSVDSPNTTSETENPHKKSSSIPDGSFSAIPFKILGIGDDGLAAFITQAGRLVSYRLESIGKEKLRVLAECDYWLSRFSDGAKMTGAHWDKASEEIIRASEHKDFDSESIRGRGAWHDGDRMSYHDGVTTSGDYDPKKIYIRLPQKDIGISGACADDDLCRKIKDTVFRLSFETPADAVRCLGWATLAPFAGALTFRPALLMTGKSGSGKTTVATHVINRIACPLWYNGVETTPAHIRQKINKDTTAIVLDETEADTEKKKANRNELLTMMRTSTSDDAPDTGKGGKDGIPISYKMKNMFCFLSIDPTVESVADEKRIFRVNMILPENGNEWKAIEKELNGLLSDEKCKAIHALTWAKLKSIICLAEKITDAIRELTGRDYRSSYADALLASAFMIIWTRTDEPTMEQVMNMLAKYYLFQPLEETRDEATEIVEKIMDAVIEIIHADGREKLSVSETLNRIRSGYRLNDDGHPIAYKSEHIQNYRLTLSRCGIVMRSDYSIAFFNNSEFIKKTICYDKGYSKLFQRHRGFVKNKNGDNAHGVYFPHDHGTRQCSVVAGLIEARDTGELPL